LGLLTKGTFFPWISTLRTSAVVRIPTDSADVVFGHIPVPGRDGVPLFDNDAHDRDEAGSFVYIGEATRVYWEDGRIRLKTRIELFLVNGNHVSISRDQDDRD
jgi:hypothetical protein